MKRHVVAIRRRFASMSRRGVASVIAMMFLIIFGSLVAAMAIVSKGNIQTASAHLHVMRAMGAAETGLRIAEDRLAECASRFVVAEGDIDASFASGLWTGSTSSLGEIVVRDPPSGHAEDGDPGGLAEALVNRHKADTNIVDWNGLTQPIITAAMVGVDPGVYQDDNWVVTPLIGLSSQDDATPPAYQVIYAPLADGVTVRAICIGYDFNYTRNGEPITRTMMKDFQLVKRVNTSILAPSRIMIGKNVRVYGDLGTRFDEVDSPNGDPLLIRSDFSGMDDALDEKLEMFFDNLATFDADGDNRLRVGHPIEGGGIPGADEDFDDDGDGDNAFGDVTGDGYVDEFDIFINHFDADGNGRVVLSAGLTAGTPAEGQTAEFVTSSGDPLDDDLALLIDGGNADRNRNGVWGYADINDNGYYDDGDELTDYDANTLTYPDQVLGYRDGFIDKMDRYAKVAGSLAFNVSSSDWVDAQGSWGDKIGGPIIPDDNQSPLLFEAPDHVLPEIGADTFTGQETDLHNAANGESFAQQVADQLGIGVEDLDAYVETQPDGTEQPRYFRLDPDTDGDGLPDNYADAYFEKMPFNSPNYADWYYRPVYENMVFRDVQIPTGTNALFYNCTFVGVTWVRTHTSNTHIHWTLYGRMGFDPGRGVPVPANTRWIYGDDGDEDGSDAYSGLPETATPPNELLLCADEPLDKADILESQVGTYNADDYALLPEPLIHDGRRITDTRELSNNIRFHSCLVVGSIVSDKPAEYTHVRNKMQFTGRTRFETTHPDYPDDPAMNPDDIDLEEIVKSSMMLPNYSVDVGSFNSPSDQDVTLQGAIIAGVLDVRGNASITGSLLLTFDPNAGEGPLVDHLGNEIGNPASFNASIGYFGPDDGDEESLDPRELPEVDGEKIVGWDLDGDGLADLGPDETPTADQIADGATAVPWNGYGRVELRFDPTMTMPDGIMLPLQMELQSGSYREGHP